MDKKNAQLARNNAALQKKLLQRNPGDASSSTALVQQVQTLQNTVEKMVTAVEKLTDVLSTHLLAPTSAAAVMSGRDTQGSRGGGGNDRDPEFLEFQESKRKATQLAAERERYAEMAKIQGPIITAAIRESLQPVIAAAAHAGFEGGGLYVPPHLSQLTQ